MNAATQAKAGHKARRSPWPTIWVALPIVEASKALEYAGTNGLAIYAALHVLRFRVPVEAKSAFHASAAQIASHSGISERRLREPLRALESGGLVKIDRPRGAARMAHQACKYSLVPFFSDSNKVRYGADNSSAKDWTNRPSANGQELGHNLSDSSIAPPTGGDIEPPTPTAAAGAVEAPAWPGVAGILIPTNDYLAKLKDTAPMPYLDLLHGLMKQCGLTERKASNHISRSIESGIIKFDSQRGYSVP